MNISEPGRGEDAGIVNFGEGWMGIHSCMPNVLIFLPLGRQVVC